jgi:hypothetical protein
MRRTCVFAVLSLCLTATNAGAADGLLPPPQPSEDAARLLAREMAVRIPTGYVHGTYVPTYPRATEPAKAVAKPDVTPCGQMSGQGNDRTASAAATVTPAAAPVVENGMRFFPIQRGASPREFRLPGRGSAAAGTSAEGQNAPGNAGVKALAQTTVQAVAPTPDVDTVTDPEDPTAAAKQAALDEIRRFRASRGLQ